MTYGCGSRLAGKGDDLTNGAADDAIGVQMGEQGKNCGARHNYYHFIVAAMLLVIVLLK